MSTRSLLGALRAARSAMVAHPQEHPTVVQSVLETLRVVRGEFGDDTDFTLTIVGSHLWREREPLPHESLEFVDLLATLRGVGVETVTFSAPVQVNDLRKLVAFAAGISPEPPDGTSIRINRWPHSREELGIVEDTLSPRVRYVEAMDTLKVAMLAVGHDRPIDLDDASRAVDHLLEVTFADPAAALLLSTLKSHDGYTLYHSVNVTILALTMAQAAGMEPEAVRMLALGALLHDVGKAKLSSGLLMSSGRLDPDDWREMQRHPHEGARAILSSGTSGHELAAVIAHQHHARFDGTGYPELGAGRPHPMASLVAVADVYDALTTRRAYRRAESPTRALLALVRGAGSEFDPAMVDLLISIVGAYPVGAVLELDDRSLLVVTAAPGGDRVEGLLVRDPDGERLDTPEPLVVDEGRVMEQIPADIVDIQPAEYVDVL